MLAVPIRAHSRVVKKLGHWTGARQFDVLVNGKIIATENFNLNRPEEFYDATYFLPPELVRGKPTATVKFAAHPGNLAGGVYGVRVLRMPTDSTP